MIHEDYCTFEQSKALKEMGFDWDCHAYYDKRRQDGVIDRALRFQNYNYDNDYMNSVSAPTLSQAAKWLRVKGIGITVQIYTKEKRDWGPNYFEGVFYRPYFTSTKDAHAMGIINNDFNSYEDALSAGIDGALKILKDNRL